MSRLERRYRLLLRVLPRWYRRKREEEMVATFLAYRDDQAPAENGWPGWSEACSTAGLALRTRMVETGTPRARALTHAAQLVALLGLLTQSALAMAGLEHRLVAALTSSGSVPWSWPSLIVGLGRALVVVASLVLLLMGRHRWARLSAILAAIAGLAPLTGCAIGPTAQFQCRTLVNPAFAAWWVTSNLPLWLIIACLYFGFRRETPVSRRGYWLLAAVAAAQVLLFLNLFTAGARNWALVSIPDWAISVGGLVYLALPVARGSDRSGAWTLALAMSAAATVPAQFESWRQVAGWPVALAGSLPLTLVETQISVTTLVALVMAMLAFRAFRHREAAACLQNS